MLGDEDDMVEGLQMGTIDMCVSAPAKMSGFVPKVELWGLPFLFKDVEHKNKVVNGPVGDAINKEIESKTKIKVMGYWQSGIRYLFNSKKAVRTPDDLTGMKVRVMPGPVEIATWKALGALPTPIAYAELYQALKQGVVDAAENDPTNILGMKFYEPCPHLSTTEHSIAARYFLMSKKTWEKLPKDIQDAMWKAAKEASVYQVKADTDMIQKSMDVLISKYGVKVTKVEKALFIEKTDSVRQEMGKKLGVEDLLKQIAATR
jgi:tripartite ATP-independent transporter DctP family solute receptor